MASNIKFKRSAVQNRVPTTAQLDLGELALNTYDGKLYTEINTGSAAVVEIGSKLSSLVVDGANGAGGGDVVFHGTTAGRDLTWDYSADSLIFNDNAKAKFGTGGDLEIYHNGSKSYITDTGTGDLVIGGTTRVDIGTADGSKLYFRGTHGGGANLYHNGNLRLGTSNDGVDIYGTGSLKIPVGTTAQRNSSPTNGDLRYNTTTGGFEGYSNNNWGELGAGGIGVGSDATNPRTGIIQNRIGVGFTDLNIVGAGISVTGYGTTVFVDFNEFKPGSFHRTIHNYTATAGQTTFAGLNYENGEKQIAVYLNGARLSEATYTATSGTTVVLDVGASLDDEVEIINIHTNSDVDRKVNTYTATAGQTTFTGLSYNSKTELDVYLNGIRLASDDFTATSGSTVVLAVGASVNDTVDIVSTGDGVSFRSTTDSSGDRFTLSNVGIGQDTTPNALNVTGNVKVVGVLTATTLHGDGTNLTNTGSSLSEPSSGTHRLVTTSLTSGTMTSSGTDSTLSFNYGTHTLAATNFSGNGASLTNLNASNLASGTVPTARLGSGTANSTTFLRGDSTFAVVDTNLVADTSPQLGGNLDVNSKSINFGDSNGSTTNIAKFGASDDLVIYHNGNHSKIIDMGTGNLYLESDVGSIYLRVSDNEQGVTIHQDGAVELYHNNSKKFETTNTGATVTGTLISDGLTLRDSEKLLIGNNTDLEIFHDGTDNIIQSDTGDLLINSGNSAGNVLISVNNNVAGNTREVSGKFIKNGAVELYYDASKKFETTSGGAKITGDLVVTGDLSSEDVTTISSVGIITAQNGINVTGGNINLGDSGGTSDDRLIFGAGSDLSIYHDGSNSYIDDSGTGNLTIRSNQINFDKYTGEALARFRADGNCELFHNNNSKFETTSYGAKTSGELEIDSGHLRGDSTNGLRLFSDSTATTGITLTTDDHLVPQTNNDQDLGSSSLRYRDIFVANDIDISDNGEIRLGDSDDLKIFHSGSHSFIVDNGTGDLKLRGSEAVKIEDTSSGKPMITCTKNFGTEIYHQMNSAVATAEVKFATLSTGAKVTGRLGVDKSPTTKLNAELSVFAATGNDDASDWGANGIFQLDHTGTAAANNEVLMLGAVSGGVGQIASGFGFGRESTSNWGTYISFKTHPTSTSNIDQLVERWKITSAGHFENNSDSVRIKLGASDDLQIYHDGTSSYLSNRGGNLYIESKSGETAIQIIPDGAVDLRHNGSKKIETSSSGVSVTGSITATGEVRPNSHLVMNNADNQIIYLGAGNDLQIFHDGSHSRIKDAGTGNLILQTSKININNADGTEAIIHGTAGGAVEIYHANSVKLNTTSGGTTTTGTATVNGYVESIGTSGRGGKFGNILVGYGNLYNTIQSLSNSTNLHLQYNVNGDIRCNEGGGNMYTRDIYPQSHNSYDLGATGARWRNIYTGDLNLSNEGSTNDVDGTWGNYTIQEGENDLFLINRRSGKKYKFNLTEVS